MKKHLLIAAAVAALAALSCAKEAVDVEPAGLPEGEEVILTAGFGDDDATRTIRQADGKVFWSANDEQLLHGKMMQNRDGLHWGAKVTLKSFI